MFWLLKILFNTRLRAEEAKRRKIMIAEAELFISEVKKLKILLVNLRKTKDTDYTIEFLKHLNFDSLIYNLNGIIFIYKMMLVSDKDADKVRKYMVNLKEKLTELISDSNLMKRFDSFQDLVLPESSIYSKAIKKVNSIDSFRQSAS
jgi:hypothetical protein